MEDSDTDFVVEYNEFKHEDQDEEDNSLDSRSYNQPLSIVHESNSADNTNVQNKCPSEEKENTEIEIHRAKSAHYIKTQNGCKWNDEVWIEIGPLDNPLNVFEKLTSFNDFLLHLKLEPDIYASQNGRIFFVSLDEF